MGSYILCGYVIITTPVLRWLTAWAIQYLQPNRWHKGGVQIIGWFHASPLSWLIALGQTRKQNTCTSKGC